MNGADVVQRFRHLPGHSSDGATVLQLRGEHPLLHKTGENGEQRQNHQQHQRKPDVLHGNHCQNRDDAAGIRHHADDAGGEQRLDSIHITRKARGNLAGILPASVLAGSAMSFCDISERRACVIFCPNSTSSVSCAEESVPSNTRLPK